MSISYLKQIEKLQADLAHLKQASEAALELVDIVTETRDHAWQELREIRETISANPEESTADEVRRVVAERDALAAQVETLKDLAKFWINQAKPLHPTKQEYDAWIALGYESKALKSTPAACLAQVRADAGRAGFVAGTECCSDYLDTYYADIDFTRHADQYAETIQQEVK